MLLFSIVNYNRIAGNESIRAIQFLSIFTIGLLSGILIFSLIEKFKKPYLYLELTDSEIERKIKEFVSRVSAMEGREIVVNVAGNRESVCPGIRTTVRELLIKCIEDDKA